MHESVCLALILNIKGLLISPPWDSVGGLETPPTEGGDASHNSWLHEPALREIKHTTQATGELLRVPRWALQYLERPAGGGEHCPL